MKRRELFKLLAATPAAWCVSKLGLGNFEGVGEFMPHVSVTIDRWIASIDYAFPGKTFAALIGLRSDGVRVVYATGESENGQPVDMKLPPGVRPEDIEIVDMFGTRKMLPPSQ